MIEKTTKQWLIRKETPNVLADFLSQDMVEASIELLSVQPLKTRFVSAWIVLGGKHLMKKLKKLFFFMLDWTWCFPQTLIGLIIAKTLWKDSYIEDQISENFYTIVLIGKEREGRLYNYLSGFSLGRYIFLHDDYGRSYTDLVPALRHEYGHSIQSRITGWLYLFVVGIPSVYGNLKARRDPKRAESYYQHYPENWADRLGKVKR